MKKVTMEMVKRLQEKNHSNKYLPVNYAGREYVQVADMNTMSGTADNPYWEALAVRIGDEVDEEGLAPAYQLIWEADNPYAEDGADTVDDWEAVDDVRESGGVDIETGRIV